MSVDEQLLAAQNAKKQKDNQSGSSTDRAGSLREQQRESDQPKTDESLRSKVMASKKEQAIKDAKNKTEERKSISFSKSQILKENILAFIGSSGIDILSYFYVVYHWFQSKLGNKRKYVQLGSEWFDMPGMTEKQRDEIGSNFGVWENCCFVSASLGCLIMIFLSLLPLILMGYYIAHPVDFVRDFPEAIWSIFKSIFLF